MPYRVRKSKAKGGGYDIVKVSPSGRQRKVGHSATKAKAKASVRARYRADYTKPAGRR